MARHTPGAATTLLRMLYANILQFMMTFEFYLTVAADLPRIPWILENQGTQFPHVQVLGWAERGFAQYSLSSSQEILQL